MLRRFCVPQLAAVALVSLAATELSAAAPVASNASNLNLAVIAQSAPGGAYLSWWKLLCVAIPFLIWVKLTDWINRDAMKIGDRTGLTPEAWSPVTTGSFLLGFLIVLFVPIFWAGYPVYLIACFTPFLIYFFMRRAKLLATPDIVHQLKGKPGEAPPPPPLPQDEGAAIEFTPAGADSKEQQVNLIRARQATAFPEFKNMLADALSKRAELVLLDYSRERVTARLQVDGVWHPLPPMDRQLGDAMLISLKSISGLNVADRRNKQTGRFDLKTESEKVSIEAATQGVPTGERVQLKFIRKRKNILTINQLGMFPDMLTKLKSSLNQPVLTIVSAPPGEGLTSTWQGTLLAADRLTRDCVAIVEEKETDTIVENIAMKRYDASAGKRQFDLLTGTLLSQPDFLALPTVDDAETMDLLTAQISKDRSVLLRTPARSAAEGLLRLYAQASDRDQFATAVKAVTGQRLIRRLCDACKQEVRVAPKTIQQLGGDPKTQAVLFNQYRLPPPEQRVDEKGNPIEFPPCPACGGIGYVGRIAVFELIEVNEQIKSALKQSPKVETIEAAAIKSGKLPIVKQAYKLVLLGVTSLAEVQRVFNAEKK